MENNYEPLTGHTSPETAYLVEDYPYGFRLRCKIRYWLEFKSGQGFRFVSQTTNPKRTGEFWNKPKASTYSMLGMMVKNITPGDKFGHITWIGVNMYHFEDLKSFGEKYSSSFDQNQQTTFDLATKAYKKYMARQVS
jgi:hypothetical protein